MSRIGRKPVVVPKGVTVALNGQTLSVKGPKGELSRIFHPEMKLALEGDQVLVSRPTEEARHKALHGLTRTLVQNMVDGVSKGFTKVLEIQGVGYKAETKPFGLQLALGFSHPVQYKAPAGIKFTVDNNTIVKIEGPDKEMVGQVAAELRSLRKPEPYKGKGVRYQGEAGPPQGRQDRSQVTMRAVKSPSTRHELRARRHLRVRKKVAGTAERPRLVVFRSLKHIYAQLVDDDRGVCLLGVGDSSEGVASRWRGQGWQGQERRQGARGEGQGRRHQQGGLRPGGYRYHGRVKAVADGAREGGLEF